MKRKVLSNTQKKYIAWQQGWKCNICSELLPFSYEIDHILPLWNHGTNELNNMQVIIK